MHGRAATEGAVRQVAKGSALAKQVTPDRQGRGAHTASPTEVAGGILLIPHTPRPPSPPPNPPVDIIQNSTVISSAGKSLKSFRMSTCRATTVAGGRWQVAVRGTAGQGMQRRSANCRHNVASGSALCEAVTASSN